VRFRSVSGVLLARCAGLLPDDVLRELAVGWAEAHFHPCKPRAELRRNFDNLLARERAKADKLARLTSRERGAR
jgi:hypothetical protein